MKTRRKRAVRQNKVRAVSAALLMFIGVMIACWVFMPIVVSEDQTQPNDTLVDEDSSKYVEKPRIQPVHIQVYTTVDLPLKSHPDESSDTLMTIPEYEIIDIWLDNKTDQWGYTVYDEVNGYVNSDYLHSYVEEDYLFDIGLEFYYQDLVKELIEVFELDVDEYFFYGMMYTESRFRNESESSSGAQGVLQIIPSTWEFLYEDFCKDYPNLADTVIDDVTDKRSNITLGMYYIKSMQDDYGFDSLSENAHEVLTMYNRGPSGANKYYKTYGTYATPYSQEILRAAEYIRVNHTWKEGL